MSLMVNYAFFEFRNSSSHICDALVCFVADYFLNKDKEAFVNVDCVSFKNNYEISVILPNRFKIAAFFLKKNVMEFLEVFNLKEQPKISFKFIYVKDKINIPIDCWERTRTIKVSLNPQSAFKMAKRAVLKASNYTDQSFGMFITCHEDTGKVKEVYATEDIYDAAPGLLDSIHVTTKPYAPFVCSSNDLVNFNTVVESNGLKLYGRNPKYNHDLLFYYFLKGVLAEMQDEEKDADNIIIKATTIAGSPHIIVNLIVEGKEGLKHNGAQMTISPQDVLKDISLPESNLDIMKGLYNVF